MSEASMKLAIIDSKSRVVAEWETTDLARKAIAAKFSKKAAGWFAFLRPRYRKHIESAFQDAVDECLSEFHKL